MATRRQPPPAGVAGDHPPATAGRADSTEQALARSREIREEGYRQIQAAREHVATARHRRFSPGAWSRPVAQDPAAQLTDASEEIERCRQARVRLVALAEELAQTEEAVAHIHDEMADRDPRRAVQYRRASADARQAARRAREIQGNAARSEPR